MKIKEFFVDEIITIPFKLFGKTHIILIFSVILALIIIYHNRHKLLNLNKSTKRKIVKTFATILLLNMLILYISSAIYDSFDYKTMLPLHLCYIANYFYIYTTICKKENYYKYVYFLSVLGPVPAIIFFDVPNVFESYNFYLYIISHHLFLIFSYITFIMYPKHIKKKDVIKLVLTLNVLYLIISIFNNYFQTNYFFSKDIPGFILKLIPIIKDIPNYIILEVMSILIIVILYIIYNYQTKKLLI